MLFYFGFSQGCEKNARRFFVVGYNSTNGHRSFLGSRKDARKMQGVFFVVGWHPT